MYGRTNGNCRKAQCTLYRKTSKTSAKTMPYKEYISSNKLQIFKVLSRKYSVFILKRKNFVENHNHDVNHGLDRVNIPYVNIYGISQF